MPEVRVLLVARLVLLAAALALVAAGSIRADPPPAPADTTVDTTATARTTTTDAAAPTTAPVTTTAPESDTTTTAPAPAAATLAIAGAPQSGCPPVGAVGLLLPHQRPVVLAPLRQLTTAQVSYPADGSVLTASALSLDTTCTDAHPTGGSAQVRDISLFEGAVTARSATLDLTGGAAAVSGLVVSGHPATLAAGHPIRIGNWGYVIAPDPAATSKSAFEIELSSEHAGLPAGTLVFIPYARIEVAPPAAQATPPPATTTEETVTNAATVAASPHDESVGARPAAKHPHHGRHKPGARPLTVTPPLEAGPYVFPVGGNASFGDTYGALRTDVPGGWHHGDDIFAPIGTPVVAVADGTLDRVGWERLGGWRLWVRDGAGDQFYYAHLSGYSPLSLAGGRVHRGEVLGFVGNTGDAFTTLPHLHFEIHPRSLLHLHYDGAVDPTRYLESWPRPGKLEAAQPVHPRLPRAAAWRHEAAVNFRELLAARGLTRPAEEVAVSAARLPPIRAADPLGLAVASPVIRPGASSSSAWVVWAGVDAALAATGLAFFGWRRWASLKRLLSR